MFDVKKTSALMLNQVK